MWGGWYANETYMSEMREFVEISRNAIEKDMGSVSEVAVFVDEKCYKYGKNNNLAYVIRESLGLMGTPYDCYLASDFERVKERYKAYVVIDPYRTDLIDSIIADADARGVPCLVISPERMGIDALELREFCKTAKVHLYTDSPAVVYANKSYIFVHARGDKLPKITSKNGEKLNPLFKGRIDGVKHPDFVSELFEIK